MTEKELMKEYASKNPGSRALWGSASDVIPGGITANVKFFAPFPLFMEKAHGACIYDADGHEYIDYVLSYGPLILGHGRREIICEMDRYISEHGTMLYGAPHAGESAFAQLLKRYYPSLEEIRYTNSGTEATLLAIRTAFAFTGKYKIAKFEGHYHGGYNEVLVSINPDVRKAGDARTPVGLRESAGISDEQMKNTVILPFNDLDAVTEILTANKDEIAGVILEPMFGGTIPATKEFMSGIRSLTEKLGILLIMDEVKTGFRVGMTGAQGYYGIRPDLTTLGKIIGAGLPVGVLGGRRDIMELAAPNGSDILDAGNRGASAAEILYHSGTYNGHPMILAMGKKTIDILEDELEPLISRTEYLKKELHRIFASHGVKILTPGAGAMFNICITEQEEILTYRDLMKCDFDLRKKLDYALLLNGIYNKPGNRFNLSTAHDRSIIDHTLEAFEKAWKRI
ncbi:MAG: aspartate aminotransferase family protein [Christensenellaceae bacterium]|nr:aspartate aminotransferase family protein [Christensenellaceae bacterium]